VRLDKKTDKLTSSAVITIQCVAYDVAREDASKMVALCANVEIAEHEGVIAMVKEIVLKLTKVT